MERFEIDKLRSIPIEGVAQRLGLNVNRHVSLCPFHDDRHPSLHFNVSKNSHKCYVCDAHGGPIDLVMNHLNLSFVDACKWLADDANIILSEYANTQTIEKETYTFQADRYVRYFERPYLSEAARRFLFDERRLDPRVISWCRITSWRDKECRDWLQIPYYDMDGNLTGIQWRNLRPSKSPLEGDLQTDGHPPLRGNEGVPRFRFPKGSKCHIYNLPVLKHLHPGEPLYIAEGCSDCWSLLSSGHKAIAIPSATTLHTQEIAKVFKYVKELNSINPQPSTINLPSIHIYPDQDIPGEKLYLQLTRIATDAGLCLIRHSLPAGCKDYSEFYLKSINHKP